MSTHLGRDSEASLSELDDVELHTRAHHGSTDAHRALQSRHFHAARRLAACLGCVEDPAAVGTAAIAAVVDTPLATESPLDVRGAIFAAVREIAEQRGTIPARPLTGAVPRAEGASGVQVAYTSLPSAWRKLLWHADVEGLEGDALAAALSVSRQDLPALVYRARSGLRDASLRQIVSSRSTVVDTCDEVRRHLASVVSRTASPDVEIIVHAHLPQCEPCMGAHLGLMDDLRRGP